LGECHREESEDEIEVTPEMIDAGYDVFMDLPECLYGCSKEAFKETIALAFRTMLKAHREPRA
jgi:hypothetical protein